MKQLDTVNKTLPSKQETHKPALHQTRGAATSFRGRELAGAYRCRCGVCCELCVPIVVVGCERATEEQPMVIRRTGRCNQECVRIDTVHHLASSDRPVDHHR